MNKIKCYTREGFVTYYGSSEEVKIPKVYQEKQEETRGVWFSTVNNMDFPRDAFSSKEKGEKFLDGVIKNLLEYNMNTIIFQVRPTCDTLYESKINPWSAYLNKGKKQGVKPPFDIFQYLINECEKVGIEVHAWINPYRVCYEDISKLNKTKEEYLNSLSKNNFARNNPDHVLETSIHKLILDPASIKVQEYLTDTVLEIANNYNIKAIHIDDYFYPYEKLEDPNEEEKKNQRHPNLSINDFRRENVNEMIERLATSLKEIDKKVELGISPFAIHRTNSKWYELEGKTGGWDKGSDNQPGVLEGYETLYCDVYHWMEKGWIDYVIPQAYFDLDYYVQKESIQKDRVKYADVVRWWSKNAELFNTKIYIGQGLYKYSEEGNWSNKEEIPNQLKHNHTIDNVLGTIFFTYHNLLDDKPSSLVEGRKEIKKLWTKVSKPL